VDPRSDPSDAGVVIARDEPPGHIAFRHGPDGLLVIPGNTFISLDSEDFHEFRVESADMVSFSLSIDDGLAYTGTFESLTLLHSFVNFGDAVQGQSSLTHWDYVRFGVIPEPSTVWLLLLGGAAHGRRS
jgi:hypothetical protein